MFRAYLAWVMGLPTIPLLVAVNLCGRINLARAFGLKRKDYVKSLQLLVKRAEQNGDRGSVSPLQQALSG